MNFLINLICIFIPDKEKRRSVKKQLKIRAKLFFHRSTLLKNYEKKLREIKQKKRKISVAFLVSEHQKWGCQSLYDKFAKSDRFEPMVWVTVCRGHPTEDAKVTYEFFKNKGLNVYFAFDFEKEKPIDLKKFKADVIFYQQPHGLFKKQDIWQTSQYALSAYVPYCFYMLDSTLNYVPEFHKILWKYFVESPVYEKEYAEKYGADNCVAVGHTKLDQYLSSTAQVSKSGKKRIIYAPHHSFDGHKVATFGWSGNLVLDIAKKHSDNIEWIFKPHPYFKQSLLKNKIMTEAEIEEYYKGWEKLGIVYNSGDYYGLFKGSDALITDCISFLAEYLPTGKPVFHLRSKEQNEDFSVLGKEIIKYYYQVYNSEDLNEIFDKVMIKGNDSLGEQRHANMSVLGIEAKETAADRIFNYITKELE